MMVQPPSQRGIGSFSRKESDMNDEEWEDYPDRTAKCSAVNITLGDNSGAVGINVGDINISIPGTQKRKWG